MSAWEGQADMREIDTTPGADGPYAPPRDWDGSGSQYVSIMRALYTGYASVRQQMQAAARRLPMLTFNGPYAEEAREITSQIAQAQATASAKENDQGQSTGASGKRSQRR